VQETADPQQQGVVCEKKGCKNKKALRLRYVVGKYNVSIAGTGGG